MGITIHFTGYLPGEAALAAIERDGRAFADARGWQYRSIDHTDADGVQYTGTVYFPHPDCEPVYLVFDAQFRLSDHVKTHFAPSAIHIAVIELMRAVAPHFAALEVDDEAGYWESSSIQELDDARAVINSRLDEIMRESPGSVRFVKERNGRIVDVYRARTAEAATALAAAFGPDVPKADDKSVPWWRRLFGRAI